MITIEILAFFDIILLLKKSLSNILNDIYYKKTTKINMEVLICQTQMKQIIKISEENSK